MNADVSCKTCWEVAAAGDVGTCRGALFRRSQPLEQQRSHLPVGGLVSPTCQLSHEGTQPQCEAHPAGWVSGNTLFSKTGLTVWPMWLNGGTLTYEPEGHHSIPHQGTCPISDSHH
ncbi:unnamed protein product [Pipistrellus nathusii]|uniref:Uncharacterized protein n=1 Tax=Pipistrellus nathusii TaxID=59473 RepID=A0ABN9ZAV4_PIPNA